MYIIFIQCFRSGVVFAKLLISNVYQSLNICIVLNRKSEVVCDTKYRLSHVLFMMGNKPPHLFQSTCIAKQWLQVVARLQNGNSCSLNARTLLPKCVFVKCVNNALKQTQTMWWHHDHHAAWIGKASITSEAACASRSVPHRSKLFICVLHLDAKLKTDRIRLKTFQQKETKLSGSGFWVCVTTPDVQLWLTACLVTKK